MVDQTYSICLIQFSAWSEWRSNIFSSHSKVYLLYISIFILLLSAILPRPFTRAIFFVLRYFSPKKWIWIKDAQRLLLWQTSLLICSILVWLALKISELDMFLCQWPEWLFGICLFIWLDGAGSVLRKFIVRKGILGHEENEIASRSTQLYEGTTLAKYLFLSAAFYIYYIAPLIGKNKSLRIACSTAFFSAMSLSILPLLRNIIGVHSMFLSNMVQKYTFFAVEPDHESNHDNGNSQYRQSGRICDAPYGYLVVSNEKGFNVAERSMNTYIPGSLITTNVSQVLHSHLWKMHLRIRCPPHRSARAIRSFMQDLDLLISQLVITQRSAVDLRIGKNQQGISTATSLTILKHRTQQPGVTDADCRRLVMELREEMEIIHRVLKSTSHTGSFAESSYLSVEPNCRWIIHVQIMTTAKDHIQFTDIRTQFIHKITQLMEVHGVGYGNH